MRWGESALVQYVPVDVFVKLLDVLPGDRRGQFLHQRTPPRVGDAQLSIQGGMAVLAGSIGIIILALTAFFIAGAFLLGELLLERLVGLEQLCPHAQEALVVTGIPSTFTAQRGDL